VKEMKKILAVLLILTFVFSLTGCNEYHRNDMINEMLIYVNEKYTDDTFQYVSMSGGHIGSNVTKIIVSSEKYPDKEIRVICTEVDGEKIFTDTYLNFKFEEQTRDYIKDKLQEEFGNNVYLKYIPDDLACTEDGSSDTTFEEYINEESSSIYISVAVPYEVENKETVNNLLQDIFSDIALSGDIYFFDVETDIGADIIEKIETKQYSEKVYISKTEIKEKYQIEWSSDN
jgi:ABC-type molybdate transport system substrate-binding protein